jgi:hypothetical protein
MISAFRRWTNKPLNRGKALSALFINQFATPGLGSLLAGRFVPGLGQLLLAVTGFGLLLAWFIRVMIAYYGLIATTASNAEPHVPPPVLWKAGVVLFGAAWLWALVTSVSLLREARANAVHALAPSEKQPPRIADFPPRL